MTRQDSVAVLVMKMLAKEGGMVKILMPLDGPGGGRACLGNGRP